MGRTVLRGAYVLRGPELAYERRPLDVVIENERITAVEPAQSVREADEIVDLSRHLLVPGLINGHLHSHEHFHRGVTENLPLELWQHSVRPPVAVPFTTRHVYLRAALGAMETLRTGATCLVDDMAVGGAINREQIDAVLQAYDDVGVRALLGFAMMDRPLVDNFPFADTLPADLLARMRALPRPSGAEYLALVRDLARVRHPRSRRVGVLVSASAPQRCTQDFLLACRHLADELDLPVITHVQETRMQVVTGQQFYGVPIVEYLARIKFLSPRTSLIHAVWLNPREIRALAEAGATVQHNPWSNLTLGSGVQATRAVLEAGVNVSLCSDGACSTVSLNMLQVAGTAAALSKVRGPDYDRWLSAREVLSAGTQGGARALGFGSGLGVIQPGALADLVAYRLDTVPFTPLHDPVRQLIYAERGANIRFVMVGGEVAMRDGRLARVNESRLLTEIQAEIDGLAEQFAASQASVAPVRDAMDAIYRRALGTEIPADTHPARFA